jgi:hypothetical protein
MNTAALIAMTERNLARFKRLPLKEKKAEARRSLLRLGIIDKKGALTAGFRPQA